MRSRRDAQPTRSTSLRGCECRGPRRHTHRRLLPPSLSMVPGARVPQGLRVGFYDNNCICGEGSSRLTPDMVHRDVAGDVRYIAQAGFDGLKADGCGQVN